MDRSSPSTKAPPRTASSSKKKKLSTECSSCFCFVLARDFERHKQSCTNNPLDSELQLVSPSQVLIATKQSLDRPETLLPPHLSGWERHTVALVHPETLSQLEVLPRQPCLILAQTTTHIATIWPCDQVAQMRFWHEACAVDHLVRVFPLPDLLIVQMARICLRPSQQPQSFYSSDHFREYVSVFLSNSYVNPCETLKIPFYGHLCEFAVEVSLEMKMADLNLAGDHHELPTVIHLSSKCTVVISEPNKEATDAKLSFSDFGGADSAKADINKYLIAPLKRNEEACSLLLTGMSGCGKTLLMNILRAELGSQAIQIRNDTELTEQLALLSNVTGKLALLIDDYDELNKKTDSACVQTISRLMDSNPEMSIVIAVRGVDEVDLSLRRRFAVEVELTVPSQPERIEILRAILSSNDALDGSLVESISRDTHGFTGADLKSLCHLADFLGTEGMDRSARFKEARKRVRPTGIRQFVLEVPDVRWQDIGGNDELKTEIQQAVIWPQLHADRFERFGIEPPSGILLYGPPGCSKTLVARALASQSHLNFLAVKGPELFSKWVGESERAVREMFRRARQVSPTILFFDEIDAVAVSRGEHSGGSGVGDRVLAQLLTELDGLEKKSGVLVLAATNRPDTLDSALLRPGRLDRAIYVPLPDEKTRLSILRLRMGRMKVGDDVVVDELVNRLAGYSGAEVVALCQQAALIAMREDLDSDMVRRRHFIDSFKVVVPRTDPKLLAIYENFQRGLLAS